MTEPHVTEPPPEPEPASPKPGPLAGPGPRYLPSPIFIGLLVLTGLGAWLAGAEVGNPRVAVFVLVTAGWLVSLCLHEFGHALVAYRAGDRSVADKGYLTLNPLRYTDAMLSIVLPLAFLLIGGIGLPGGAVWIDRGRIRGRLRQSLVSAAGPLVNLALAVLLLVLVSRLSVALPGHDVLWAGLAFLAFLEVTATLINLIPLPGLDGFGIIEPWLPRQVVASVAGVGQFGFLALVLLLFIPRVGQAFFDAIYAFMQALGVEPLFVQLGLTLYRFWSA